MAGKKKKSLANRLSRMSDEERARYLQHRADMDEEAKRRKEQLIATFMKKKIKKEDAFSRLNLAKINQQWHQILRKAKCQEMKDNVLHMKKWITRVMEYKNRTIAKLLEELEESEEQYSNNFQSHSIHIDKITESQNEYMKKIKAKYHTDLETILDVAENDVDKIIKKTEAEQEYLKTVLFGQECNAEKSLKKQYDYYTLRNYAIEEMNRLTLSRLMINRDTICSAIWKQIAEVIKVYVQQTDESRMHLAELRRLDSESAEEIRKNQEYILQEENLLDALNKEFLVTTTSREEKVKKLDVEFKGLSSSFLIMKNQLQIDLKKDKEKITFITDISNKTIHYLETLLGKGQQLIQLMHICKKFETEREKISKFLFILQNVDKEPISTPQKAIKPKTAPPVRSLRPKTSILGTPTPENITTISHIKISAKTSGESPSSPSSSSSSETSGGDILLKTFENLQVMENFWLTYSKVEVDFMEIQEEKKILMRQNKQMRGMIRAVLEAATLAQSIPNTRVSTRVPSKRRSACSAPARRILFAK